MELSKEDKLIIAYTTMVLVCLIVIMLVVPGCQVDDIGIDIPEYPKCEYGWLFDVYGQVVTDPITGEAIPCKEEK